VRIHEDAWLSAIMERDVLRLELGNGSAMLRDDLQRRTHAFYFAKVDCADVATARELVKMGFYVVDVNLTFALSYRNAESDAVVRTAPEDVVIREASAEDAAGVLQVAERCFRYSRFHLDPLLPTALANRIKREWINNYLIKARGDSLLVALLDGRPVGFLASLVSGPADEHTATIDLVGVDVASQRRSVGQSLVQAFLGRYRTSKVLQVGTQAANVPSVRLYEKLGFSLTKSQYVLHLHVRDGRVES
jgi:ribosomal protein S18 acetylase RimI-like enzyme